MRLLYRRLVNNHYAHTTIQADVTTQVINRISGLNTTAFSGFSVNVSGTPLLQVATLVNNLAVAGDLITVTVTGTYTFMNIIPLITMPAMTLTSAPTMVCEGAT